MSESRFNPQALLKETMPRFPPAGRAFRLAFAMNVVPKPDILMCFQARPGEYLDVPEGTWQPSPAGVTPHVLGEPLAPEKCEVVLTICCEYHNTAIMTKNGRTIAGVHIMPVDLAHFSMVEFIQVCEGTLPSRLVST